MSPPSSPAASRLLSVIVVAADSGPALRECIRNVLDWPLRLELLVLDNASNDGVPQAAARAWAHDPRLQVIYNRENLGFGTAVNRGAAQSSGDVLLVLNPDCMLAAPGATRLLEVLDSDTDIGLVGAVTCNAQGKPDPASWRRDPLFRRAVASMLGLARAGVNITRPLPDHPVDAEAVSGALMLLPRRVFERVGGFDPGYFLHCEDLDLCRRVRDTGLRVVLAADVHVLHAKGGSSAHRPIFVSRHKHRGMWRWFRKFDPAARNPLLAGLVWLGIWAHFALQLPILFARKLLRRPGGNRHGEPGRGQ
ncbi:MAG: glycosyltransferase family 2 protein [Xanthomonadales bacterium]|nr:glycosyltransferase family 2 protein [Xanthomonadales bacterium]